MSGHTPGPWFIGPHYRGAVESTQGRICECPPFGSPRGIANAILIAAAPDLLENARIVLKGFAAGVFVRNVADDDKTGWAITALPYIDALARLEAAIRQAEGGPEA